MGDMSKGVASTLYPAKKIYKHQKKRERKLSEKACYAKVLK
jgi:hypothetical protein